MRYITKIWGFDVNNDVDNDVDSQATNQHNYQTNGYGGVQECVGVSQECLQRDLSDLE